MALGKVPMPGRPIIWMIVGPEPTALAVGAAGGCLDILLSSILSLLSPSIWETVRYRLKYCLKGQLNPKQPTKYNSMSVILERWLDYNKRLCAFEPRLRLKRFFSHAGLEPRLLDP